MGNKIIVTSNQRKENLYIRLPSNSSHQELLETSYFGEEARTRQGSLVSTQKMLPVILLTKVFNLALTDF